MDQYKIRRRNWKRNHKTTLW